MQSFFEKLERIRQRPERQRKSIAMLLTLCFAGILLIFWFSTLGPKAIKEAKQEPKEDEENIASPFENIGSEFDNIGESLKKLQESVQF